MWKDPIVEEIHKIREEIAREYDYNLNRIMDHLRKKEIEHADRMIYKKEMNRKQDVQSLTECW